MLDLLPCSSDEALRLDKIILPGFLWYCFYFDVVLHQTHASHILGFKFQYYQRPEVEDSVPAGLYRLAATLIKEDFIDLDSMYVAQHFLYFFQSIGE
jgi:hypothetical protein